VDLDAGNVIAIVAAVFAALSNIWTRGMGGVKKDIEKLQSRLDEINTKGCNYTNALRVEMLEKFVTVKDFDGIKETLDEIHRSL
jgi:tetrahydromethanopterin S-methyltransferase subunit G